MLHLKRWCNKARVYPGHNYKVDVIYLSYYNFTFRIVPFSENTGFLIVLTLLLLFLLSRLLHSLRLIDT